MRFFIALFVFLASPALGCGPDSDCPVGDRIYRIALPEGHDGSTPVPALIWSHGYRGSAAGVMRNSSMRRMLSDAGIALIAAQGVNGTWDLPYGPRTYDSDGSAEFAYFDAVIADVTANQNIDPDRIIAAGFSAGGMMVWNLACARPETFAGFIPLSGTFWLKPPDTCAAPVTSIVHIHGTTDKTVPLKGRAIGETKQGEVEETLSMYEKFGDFGASNYFKTGPLICRNRSNPDGEILQYCLFDGGHSFRTEYLGHGIQELHEAGRF
ncbi:putative polyhydroxybutyrate depolymerase [Sulfitobacter noctilucicola]|uniref:Polyhydroxybutyrate depolymerase n=1 Tax=Sulfitobacter noctilucicola TaxID=1342301 RepID=A0A7W6MA40_9RHOB|nr:prolyl oligopeptidase family serine peptidase [Sulfitobacter noctilucicola]KIN63282.1 putative polyhydroxybutyrate depolymerase [Sulfitobacter noctilucicola]MBB4175199.1 polyhydroxybutyrate depolymerase [Sulfitobacter noctilucicola]